MSELKMRDALITAREALVLEGYADDNLAVVKIDEALAQQPAAVVELTADDLAKLAEEAGVRVIVGPDGAHAFQYRNGGVTNLLTRFAGLVAAHIAKQQEKGHAE